MVVGAGHNALVAACYLARAGLDVEVVERDSVVGGAVSTVERFPGYRMDRGSSAHIMIRHTGIVEDLRLAEVGLVYQDLDPWGFAPFGEAALTFWVDLDRTCASIAAVCGEADADAYRRFVDLWRAHNERIFAAFQAPPTARNVGRALWKLGGPGMETARQFLQPADALLDAQFTDERFKSWQDFINICLGGVSAGLNGSMYTCILAQPQDLGGKNGLSQRFPARKGHPAA